MYCRTCKYDLRGQVEPRCPECGRGFEPGNPKTYSLTKPILLGIEARHLRVFLWVTLACGVPLLAFYDVNKFHLRHFDGVRIQPNPAWHSSTFQTIVLDWALQRGVYPNNSDFDLDMARTTLNRLLDRRSLHQLSEWNFWTSSALWVPWLTMSIMLLGALRSRCRRKAVAILAGCLLLATGLSFCENAIADRLWPAGYDYLQDYVYVRGLNWSQADSATIIAFEAESWYGKFRYVAFADFRVGRLPESEFRKLLATQGLNLHED